MLRIAILGYKSTLVGKWDPDTTSKGLPGSEECVVYASEELVRRGHQVAIYMNPPEDSAWQSPDSNPQWFSVDRWSDYSNKAKYDVVLMWRRYDVAVGRSRGKKVIFWPHDSPQKIVDFFPPFPVFDGIFLLSKWHHHQFEEWPGFDKIPRAICGNGYPPEQFENPMTFTNPYSVGYFSSYSRGLIVLLWVWPDVWRQFPKATLDIYYGREHWGTMPEAQLDQITKMIKEFRPIGVVEHGKVGHLELAQSMKNTSVFAYPCICPGETFCITAVKCQASGCIPVTTRIGALNETIHPDAPHVPVLKTTADIEQYKQLLIHTLRRIHDQDPLIPGERQKYISWAQQFTWERCVDKWLTSPLISDV